MIILHIKNSIRPSMTIIRLYCIASLFLGGVFAPSAFAQSQLPNIVYIYADDLGYGELGCYGQSKIRTPHLDSMAAQGMRFTQHYAGAPVCAPSRCMLLTGSHSGHAAIRANREYGGFGDAEERGQHPLPDSVYTVAEMLRQRGYRTGMVGKWGLGVVSSGGSPLRHGFDYYYGYLDQKQAHNFYPTHLWENDHWDTLNNSYVYVHSPIDSTLASDDDFKRYEGNTYAPDRMTAKALDFIKNSKEQPFFLYIPYTLPHLSLQVPASYADQYRGQFDETPYYGQHGYAPCKFPKSSYAAMITYLDQQVGLILSTLRQHGLDENTLVFFSSDNGAASHPAANSSFFNSNSSLRGFKGDLYEGGIRVPMLARWPGKIRQGSLSSHVCTQSDMLATLAAITGQEIDTTDGISFLPTLLGDDAAQRLHPWLYFEFSEYGGQLAVFWQGWKAVSRHLLHGNPTGWELYYLPDDEGEQSNLADSRPDIIMQIEAIVSQAHQCPSLREWEVIRHD